MMQLLHQFFPDMKTLETLGKECKVLFIFDGLDETLLPLSFKHNKVLRDETEPASLDVLITNLITGDLLGNALIWITSRPVAASRIPRKHIDQWTEVRGFTDEQREEYFKRSLRDDNLAIRIIKHVKSSRSLYTMCQIPVFCWITVTVMKKMLRDDLTGGMPNTLTEMYAYLLLCQTDRMIEGHYPMESANVALKLAELAYRQLEKGQLIFYEADLKECGMDVKEATIYSGVCTEVFVMDGRRRQEVFSFVHLTIQEFLAAVYAHHSYVQRRDNVVLGYLKRMSTRWLPKSVFKFHKTAIEKALQSKDGRWDLFLRFLMGLSLKSNQELLGKILDMKAEGEEDVARTAKLNLFHCLSELKEESLVQEIQNFVSSGTLAAKTLSPVQWSALTFELMTSEATEEEFDLKRYIRSEEGVVKLLAVIISYTRALLNCCNLTENCCTDLAIAMSSTSSHLTELDLSENSLKDSGVKLLSVGLGNPHCKLKSLRSVTYIERLKHCTIYSTSVNVRIIHELNQCKLIDSCCKDLASVLSTGSSHLKNLDLSDNTLKDSGVAHLAVGLRSPQCGLETLRLSWCGLTQKCCDHIGSALSSDSAHLRELDLAGNNLQGPDIQLLCAGLRSPHCKLETLRVTEGNLQKCCADFASVLCSDTSYLKELDLSGNDLEDPEVKLLSAGLASPHCQLETLRLSFCGVTEEGCTFLASALSSNPSHLRQLDLSYNHLQDSGVKLISLYRDNPLCKLEKLSVDHDAECYLKSTLKKYACTLTFDTNTAAQSLFLHDGGKQVTWVRQIQQHPGHPERYESVSQVLCHQGLTRRHYWEVEWRGRWVDVAVATRGIRRRASPYLCAFGNTDQSWSLYCSEDHYSVQHDHQSVRIAAPLRRSNRVGVFLDWLGGTLSFYSVSSGTLSHIYTFYSPFTEPLYAGFGMEEEDCSVIICTEEDVPQIISRPASAKGIDEY
uniref:B30.2/SPRY domain-containing protein n=1 Tax=Scophthalmus maximus TaxID=52904 RepID=A0A8D3AQ20_SCOMX